jgi:hypothetical protein
MNIIQNGLQCLRCGYYLIGAIPVVCVLIGYREIRQTQYSTLIYNFNQMSRTTCFDPLKGGYKKCL